MIYCCLYFLFLHKHFWILTVTDKSYYFKFLVTKQEYNVLLFVLDVNIGGKLTIAFIYYK